MQKGLESIMSFNEPGGFFRFSDDMIHAHLDPFSSLWTVQTYLWKSVILWLFYSCGIFTLISLSQT